MGSPTGASLELMLGWALALELVDYWAIELAMAMALMTESKLEYGLAVMTEEKLEPTMVVESVYV